MIFHIRYAGIGVPIALNLWAVKDGPSPGYNI